jgi:hypothetical protein
MWRRMACRGAGGPPPLGRVALGRVALGRVALGRVALGRAEHGCRRVDKLGKGLGQSQEQGALASAVPSSPQLGPWQAARVGCGRPCSAPRSRCQDPWFRMAIGLPYRTAQAALLHLWYATRYVRWFMVCLPCVARRPVGRHALRWSGRLCAPISSRQRTSLRSIR